jgi:CRP-like cAMP-binding protein
MEKIPDEFNTTFTTATHGKRFTIQEGSNEGYTVKTIQILNQHYPGISKEWQDALINNMRLVKYNRGDVIMKQGDVSNGETYVILSGEVHVLFHDGKGFQQQAINQAGDLVGEMAILNKEKIRSASIVAGMPVTLGAIDGEVLYAFLRMENRIESIQKMLKTRSILERLFRNHGVSVSAAQQISYAGIRRKTTKDEVVIEQGATDSDLFFILDGKFRVIRNGKELNVLGPRCIFGEFGSTGARFRNATIKALEDGEVFQVQKEIILPIIRSTPALHFFINQLMIERERAFRVL